MTNYLSKFTYGEKFESLPDIQLDARGGLRLENTKIDMIPAGLKGVTFVYFNKKPRYIAPDFDGIVVCYDPHNIYRSIDMDKMEIETAKARYISEREKIEKPRYIQEKDGSLSLCSLPTNIQIFYKQFEGGYFLDLTRTSVTKEQKLHGFKEVILNPKKAVQEEFPFVLAQKVPHFNSHRVCRQMTKNRE